MATSNPPKPSNLLKIIWEALIFLTNNWKPALIYIFFYSTFFPLSFFQSSAITPIITNLQQNLISLSKLKPQDPDFYQTLTVILTEIREITAKETVFYVAIFFLSTLLLASTLCFICMAYADKKQPELKELLSKFRRTWKGALITQFYVTIFGHMSVFISFLLTCGIALFSVNFAGVAVSFVLLILGVILYPYLAMIWLLSVVVSVEEEEGGGGRINGLAAIVKATEMMKGRRLKGILIAFILILLNLVVCLPPLMHLSSSESKEMVILGIFFVVGAVVKLFELVVVVVFYFECRNGGGLKMNKFGAEYSKLASEDTVDSEIP
ncbi:uncharacterized protein LOC110024385 [Phalaenopsis equestris]|uniref:uncharacterized protein LOC110024385 n=1 Tax=Phalaenopsis equestris TaxID=78828 RepID=UPI0009E30074|nr:uncharacterized protein LOC110024385 [Phalaenopsis equestris]